MSGQRSGPPDRQQCPGFCPYCFEKKQAIDNATKVANFGTLYWAHLRLGRLNGRNFIASRADFGGNPFTWRRRVASSPLDRHAAWPIGTLLPAAPQLTNWSFT